MHPARLIQLVIGVREFAIDVFHRGSAVYVAMDVPDEEEPAFTQVVRLVPHDVRIKVHPGWNLAEDDVVYLHVLG